jgi:5-methylcytosine-specific restriction endonuclease McrA
MPTRSGKPDPARLDRIVAEARRASDERAKGYREQALKLKPWICGRCAREFDRTNVHQLTVHHRDHDHHHNPPDGSNWELLCVYCHDNEHSRELETAARPSTDDDDRAPSATHRPFADLAKLLKGGGGDRDR